MTTREPWDAWAAELDGLGTHDASPECAARIRAHCLAALVARRQAHRAEPAPALAWRDWLAPALGFGISAVCLAVAIGTTLQLAEVLRIASRLSR